MFAIFETGGKQHRAEKGAILQIEKLEDKEGDKIDFERVFLFSDGETTELGKPFVEGVTVKAKVLNHGRDKKIRVVKFKAKKRSSSRHSGL